MLAFATITSLALFAASSVRAANHTILVGGAAGLVFTPSNISAAVGDFGTSLAIPTDPIRCWADFLPSSHLRIPIEES